MKSAAQPRGDIFPDPPNPEGKPPKPSAASVDDRLLRAIDTADKTCTSMTAFGPVNDKWMRGFHAALAAEGLAIVEAEWVLERADADDRADLSYDRETISGG